MWFEVNASGISIKLQIRGYRPTDKDNWDSQWCKCDFAFSSGDWLNYHKENDEVLLSCEVEQLTKSLTELLANNLMEETEIVFIEPDFIFKLFPQKDLRNDPKYIYVRPGCEIQDIYLEWKIYFWDGGLTDNFLTVTFGREEIIKLRDYFAFISSTGMNAT